MKPQSWVTYSRGTDVAPAREASWVSLLHWKVSALQRQMVGQVKAQQERTSRTAERETRSQTARRAMCDTGPLTTGLKKKKKTKTQLHLLKVYDIKLLWKSDIPGQSCIMSWSLVQLRFQDPLLPSRAVVIASILPAWEIPPSEAQAEFSLTAELQRCDVWWVETINALSDAGDVVKPCCHSYLCS